MHEPDALSARETKREFEAVASGDPSATPPKTIPAPERWRAMAGSENGCHFSRVFPGFRGYDERRERVCSMTGERFWSGHRSNIVGEKVW